MTNKTLTISQFTAISVELGGVQRLASLHIQYRAAFFRKKDERDAFRDLMNEEYPLYSFFGDTLDGFYICQFR